MLGTVAAHDDRLETAPLHPTVRALGFVSLGGGLSILAVIGLLMLPTGKK